MQLPTGKTTNIITWHARRFASGAEWKFESEANDTAGPEFTVISNSRNVQVDELKHFWDKHSRQLIEKRNSCAHLCNCFAVWCSYQRRKRSRTAFFYAELNWLADILKHLRQGQVHELQPYWEKYLMQVFELQAYIEKRNSCAYLQMFCCVVPSEGNKCYGRSYEFHRWTFVTEVLAGA